MPGVLWAWAGGARGDPVLDGAMAGASCETTGVAAATHPEERRWRWCLLSVPAKGRGSARASSRSGAQGVLEATTDRTKRKKT